MDCSHLSQDRDQWWAVVDTVMNPQVSHNGRNLDFLAPNESLNSMQIVRDKNDFIHKAKYLSHTAMCTHEGLMLSETAVMV